MFIREHYASRKDVFRYYRGRFVKSTLCFSLIMLCVLGGLLFFFGGIELAMETQEMKFLLLSLFAPVWVGGAMTMFEYLTD